MTLPAIGASILALSLALVAGNAEGIVWGEGFQDFEHMSAERIGTDDESQSKRQADMQSMSDCSPQGQGQSDLQSGSQAQAGAGLSFFA